MPPRCVALSLVAVLAACQSVPPPAREPGPVNDALRESAAASRQQPTPPSTEVLTALLPDNKTASAEPRFDLNVNNVDARQFFMGLVAGTPYNILVRPDVTGSLSLTVRNVSVPDVMEMVRDVYGYDYERKGNVFTVSAAGLQTAIIPVNYLNLTRKGESQTRVNSGQVADAGTSEGQSSSGNSSTAGSQAATIPGTLIETQSEANLWGELQATLQTLIAGSAGGSVVVNPQAGLAIVRALPADLRMVRQYLSQAEQHLQRQVILEAKILEVTLSDGFQAGINWSDIASAGGTTGTIGQSGQELNLRTEPNDINGFFTGVFTGGDFQATLELLRTQGTVQVLSSPRVSTVNNQKAVIKVGTDEFFVTGISTTTTTGAGGNTSTPNVTLSPFFSGIALDVTPQIDEHGEITLHVHPSVTEVQDQTKQIDFGTSNPLILPLALSSVREADSIVRARSGQIVVIGGLMQDKLSQDDAGVPWLSEIPWLGKLFTQQREGSAKSELVILLRPVVTDDSAWQQDIDRSHDRVRRYTGDTP